MQLRKTINWQDPLSVACGISNQESWALLYSGLNHGFTGHYSILALQADDTITASDFSKFAAALSSDKHKFDNAWFGYLGYGLKDSLEKLPIDSPYKMDMPDLYMLKYRLILLFDHVNKSVEIWSKDESDLQYLPQAQDINEAEISVSNLASNMSKSAYIQKVEIIKQAIARGDLYQANLTRKFFGNIKTSGTPFDIFCKLCRVSPAPYSVFMKLGDKFILSSSPERFLQVSNKGEVDTRPIKGSAPRFTNCDEDLKSKTALENSEKDRAENLMIVDLSRNDLSRGCVAGTVRTENLFEVTSYATVHHMASTVKGQKRPDVSTIKLVQGCFPPGSMTGAPKIKAMQLCTELEQLKRGVYAGAIGWFGGDGSCDLSVVIRTIIIDGDNFEFQVGGAIVSDSTPENEWKETLTKAKAIAMTLGIEADELAGL
jgi:para-aminobenzoate synthetase component 1